MSDNIDLTKVTYEHIISQLNDAVAEKCNTIIGLMLIDGFLYRDNEEFYSMLRQIQEYAIPLGITQFKLVVGIAEQYQHKLDNRGIKFEII
jgi:hypothetical protein